MTSAPYSRCKYGPFHAFYAKYTIFSLGKSVATDLGLLNTTVNQSGTLEASYVHAFRKGVVVCTCVFGDDRIASDPSAQNFLLLGIIFRHPSGGSVPSQWRRTKRYRVLGSLVEK